MPLGPLFKHLGGDEFTSFKAAKASAALLRYSLPFKTNLSSAMDTAPSSDLTPLWDWSVRALAMGPQQQDMALQILGSALSPVPVRKSFWAHPTAPQAVAKLLSGNAQMTYQAAYVFWLLSFDEQIAGELNEKCNIIPIFMDLSKSAIKEKVVRIVVATFRVRCLFPTNLKEYGDTCSQ